MLAGWKRRITLDAPYVGTSGAGGGKPDAIVRWWVGERKRKSRVAIVVVRHEEVELSTHSREKGVTPLVARTAEQCQPHTRLGHGVVCGGGEGRLAAIQVCFRRACIFVGHSTMHSELSSIHVCDICSGGILVIVLGAVGCGGCGAVVVCRRSHGGECAHAQGGSPTRQHTH